MIGKKQTRYQILDHGQVSFTVNSPLLEVTLTDSVESICANCKHSAQDGRSTRTLDWDVSLVADWLVATPWREVSVRKDEGEEAEVSDGAPSDDAIGS